MDIERFRPFFLLYGYSPVEYSYELFSATHLGILCVLAVMVAGICLAYKKLETRKRVVMLRVMAVALLLQEAFRQFSIFLFYYERWRYYVALPLHLCTLMIFVGLVHAFVKNKYTGEILYGLGLPGFFAALLFPDWVMLPVVNFYALNSYLSHSLQIAFVFMLMYAGELRPNPKNMRYNFWFISLIAPIIYVINIQTRRNYLYINFGLPNSPIEILTDTFGNPGFLIPYALVVAAVVAIFYVPFIILNKKGMSL